MKRSIYILLLFISVFISCNEAFAVNSLFSTPIKTRGSNHFGAEVGVGRIGGCAGMDFSMRFQHDYSKYISWDCISLNTEFIFDKPSDFTQITFRTGLRGYSPYFYDEMRAYTNIAIGGGVNMYDESYYKRRKVDICGTFSLNFGIGIQLTNHLYTGYALNWDVESQAKAHLLQVGVVF